MPEPRLRLACLAALLAALWIAPAAAEEAPVPHVYRDAAGTTHLVKSLAEVPAAFRESAQPLGASDGRVEYQERTTGGSAERLARARARARALAQEQAERRREGVIFYSASWCGYCNATRRYLQEERVPFEERSIDDPAIRRELTAKIGQPAVPVVQYEDRVVIGWDPKALERLGF